MSPMRQFQRKIMLFGMEISENHTNLVFNYNHIILCLYFSLLFLWISYDS